MEGVETWNVKGKVVLVTGGAAGIGAGLVRGLLIQNASHVAFLDILEREGESLEVELLNNFGALKAKFIKCDISNDEELARAYKQVIDKYRRLDAVINNAAVIGVEEGFDKKTVDVNLSATINSTLKALELMRVDNRGGGGIVLNMSSVEALQQKSPAVYSATKFAVLQFSNQIATEEMYAKTAVRIVTVCLGPTDTALLHRHNYNKEQIMALEISERQRNGRYNNYYRLLLEQRQIVEKFDEQLQEVEYNITTTVKIFPSIKIHHVHQSDTAFVSSRVTSAVAGIMGVINSGSNGSAWIIAGDKPPVEVTTNVREGFKIISMATNLT